MLKIFQARLQQYVNWELPDIQAGFRKGRIRDKIANICWLIEKVREFQKTSTTASLTMLKPLTVWITTNCGKFLKRWEYQTTLPASWETCTGQVATVRTGMKTSIFQSCDHCWVFQICWLIECSTLIASSFRILKGSAGIPSPPLALFLIMFLRPTWLHTPRRLALGEWSHHHG